MILLVQGVLTNKSTITVDGQNSTWPKISSTALKGSMNVAGGDLSVTEMVRRARLLYNGTYVKQNGSNEIFKI